MLVSGLASGSWCLFPYKALLLYKLMVVWFYHLWNSGCHRADSRFVPSQWETSLLCNHISHWQSSSLEQPPLWHHHCITVANFPASFHWPNSHMLNSLDPGRCGSNYNNVISTHMLWIKFVNTCCEIFIKSCLGWSQNVTILLNLYVLLLNILKMDVWTGTRKVWIKHCWELI